MFLSELLPCPAERKGIPSGRSSMGIEWDICILYIIVSVYYCIWIYITIYNYTNMYYMGVYAISPYDGYITIWWVYLSMYYMDNGYMPSMVYIYIYTIWMYLNIGYTSKNNLNLIEELDEHDVFSTIFGVIHFQTSNIRPEWTLNQGATWRNRYGVNTAW